MWFFIWLWYIYRLVIINRVFKYAGAVSEKWYNIQKKVNVAFYVFFTAAFGGLNLTYIAIDMYNTKHNFYEEQDESQDLHLKDIFLFKKIKSTFNLKDMFMLKAHLSPSNDVDIPPSQRIIELVTFILGALTFASTVIGSFLVNRLRAFFRENYWKHSNSIILSIALVILSTGAMICWTSIRLGKNDVILIIE